MTATSVPAETVARPDGVIIFDTTLRDGEQSPGCSMTVDREAPYRRGPRGHGRRCDRGRLPDRIGRRFPGGARGREARPRERGLRRPRTAVDAKAGGLGTPAPTNWRTRAGSSRSRPDDRRQETLAFSLHHPEPPVSTPIWRQRRRHRLRHGRISRKSLSPRACDLAPTVMELAGRRIRRSARENTILAYV